RLYSAPTGLAATGDTPTISVAPSGDIVVPSAGDSLAIVLPPVKIAKLNVIPTINPKSKGDVPVVILGSKDFNVGDLDLGTVRFGHTGLEKSLASCEKAKDTNKDGFADLTCHFENSLAGFQSGDKVAK